MRFSPLVGDVALRGPVEIESRSGIVRTVDASVRFRARYPAQSPLAFVRRGQFEPQNAERHFRPDRSCCLWFARAEDGWNPQDPNAFEHFLQQMLVFFDRQLTYDSIGDFPGETWRHDRPIADLYLEERLGGDTDLVAAFKAYRHGRHPRHVVECPCGSGEPFAQCHEADFVDLRHRLAGLELGAHNPQAVAKNE